MTNRKSLTLAALSTISTLAITAPQTFASTNYLPTSITLNGSSVTNASHVVAIDPWAGGSVTSWLPIYYVVEAMSKIGVNAAWNGNTETWTLTTSGGTADTSNAPTSRSTNAGVLAVTINGTAVEYAPRLVAKDPDSGVDTTYLPIYYVTQMLSRLGVVATWNGATWGLTNQASANAVSQQTAANAEWHVFDATTWDVNTHPTMTQVGVTPPTAPATAGDVASWLASWAGQAKGYVTPWDITDKGTMITPQGTYEPFSLQWESSTDPYTWATQNDLYQGTNITSASNPVTSSELTQIMSNLQWWLTGYKVVDGVYHLHAPMYGNYVQYASLVDTGEINIAQYMSGLAETTHYYDELTATVSNNQLNLTLPSVKGAPQQTVWQVDARDFTYGWNGATTVPQSLGGLTLHIPFDGPVITITAESITDNLVGCNVSLKVSNEQVDYSPYDESNGQPIQ